MNQKLKMSEEKQNNGIKFRQEVFEPLELFNAIIAKWDQYEGFEQQDSHELLRHLLDGIRDEQINVIFFFFFFFFIYFIILIINIIN